MWRVIHRHLEQMYVCTRVCGCVCGCACVISEIKYSFQSLCNFTIYVIVIYSRIRLIFFHVGCFFVFLCAGEVASRGASNSRIK